MKLATASLYASGTLAPQTLPPCSFHRVAVGCWCQHSSLIFSCIYIDPHAFPAFFLGVHCLNTQRFV